MRADCGLNINMTKKIKKKPIIPQVIKRKDRAKKELREFENMPLVGGFFRGLEKLIDLAKRVEKEGGEIKEVREIKGKNGETKGICGISIKTGIMDSKSNRKKVKIKSIK